LKIRDLIANIDKSKPDNCAIDKIADEFDCRYNLDYDRTATQTNLVSYWLACWYCTDTWVGIRLYFLDGEFVAISHQTARKNDEIFYWASKDLYLRTKKFVESYCYEDECQIQIVDFEEDVTDGYNLSFGGQLLHHTVCKYEGKIYPIDIEKTNKLNHQDYINQKIVINNPEELVIDIEKVEFLFNLMNPKS
jgi:hypothetical protein